MYPRARLVIAPLLVLAACSSPTATEGWETIAYIATDEKPPEVDVPAEVRSGEEFVVRVRTWGTGGCTTKGQTSWSSSCRRTDTERGT